MLTGKDWATLNSLAYCILRIREERRFFLSNIIKIGYSRLLYRILIRIWGVIPAFNIYAMKRATLACFWTHRPTAGDVY